MGLTRLCLNNPAAVAVGVAFIVIIGLVSLAGLPVQLFPDIEEPVVNINTGLRSASPEQVEADILEPQEDVLRGISGLKEIIGFANPGEGNLQLRFDFSADPDFIRQEVTARLQRTPALPADANRPFIMFSNEEDSNSSLIFLFVQALPGNERPIESYQRLIEDLVIPPIEAVEGVSRVSMESGRPSEEELKIEVDPFLAAQYGLSIPDVAASIGGTQDISAGYQTVGRRMLNISVEAGYSPEELKAQILTWRDGTPIRLGDVATIQVKRSTQYNFAFQNGNPALGLRVIREPGSHVLTTLDAVKAIVERLQPELKEHGLTIRPSFDPSVFIRRAINLLTGNLVVGVFLSVAILWAFLREIRATLVIAITIPICLLTTFAVLKLTGRTLNVISLAGLAFAVGMVLDAAIVVLENIVRLREKGEDKDTAASLGAGQVWGALVASTATTVAIFIPVIFMKDLEGQLFADLSLTIAIAVSVSLLVAVTILPVAARHWMKRLPKSDGGAPAMMWIADTVAKACDTPKRRMGIIVGLTGASILATWVLLPPLSYLPPVKRDAVDAFLGFPPGTSVETVRDEVARAIDQRLMPYFTGEKEPRLKNWYTIGFPEGLSVGARVVDQTRVKEMERIIQRDVITGFPDAFGGARQGNLFGGFGDEGSISLNLQSADTEAIRAAARRAIALVEAAIPGANVNAQPYPELSQPELRFAPKDERLNELGWNRQDLAQVVQFFSAGLYLGEYFDGTSNLNVILGTKTWATPDELLSYTIVTPGGALVPLSELATVTTAVGAGNIRRVDGRRTYSIQINPPDDMALSKALSLIQTQVEPQLRAMMPADGRITYGGSANGLNRAIMTMGQNFAFALGLLFLLLAGLFRSLRDAALVIISIPLATVGGVVALQLLNVVTFQPLDLLTMIGFIILLGLVVNNAILLVDQTRRLEGAGTDRKSAVAQALETRLRPIFMSTLTSIVGMLPLVVFPGVGSVIYRGLATTIVGGMAVSLVFTLLLLPALLRLGEGKTAVSVRSAPRTGAATVGAGTGE